MDTNDAPRPASSTALRRFRTPIRGHAFAAPPPEAGPVDVGTTAALVREPANPADPLAVAVWITLDPWGPWRLGYLDRGVAARIAPRLDAGLELHARVEGWTLEPAGRWQRPLLALWPAVARERPAAPRDEPVVAQDASTGRSTTTRGASTDGSGSSRGVSSVTSQVGRSPVERDERVERRLPGVRRRRVA